MSFLGIRGSRAAFTALGLVTAASGMNACGEQSGGYDSCFAAGTPVATPNGDVAIEALRVGDAVFAYDLDPRAQQDEDHGR